MGNTGKRYMKKLLKTFAAASLIILSATAARAEFYVGGAIGSTAMVPTVAEDSINKWIAAERTAYADCNLLACYSEEETSGGVKLFAGYRINDYFAVEGFAAYLGYFESFADDGSNIASLASANVTTSGVAALGMFPLGGQTSIFAKFGVHSWLMDGTVNLWDDGLVDGVLGTYTNSGSDFMGGIGAEFEIAPNAALRLELEYFAADTGDTDFGIGLFSIGGLLKF